MAKIEMYSNEQARADLAKVVAALFSGIQPNEIQKAEEIDEQIASKAFSLIDSEMNMFLQISDNDIIYQP